MTEPEPERVEVLGQAVGDEVTILGTGQIATIEHIEVWGSGAWFYVAPKGYANRKKLRREGFS